MRWDNGAIEELTAMCFAEESNADIANYFNVPITEIYAKRSQLGITIPKVSAAKGKPPITLNIELENALKGLETFKNDGDLCIVLARVGDIALIVRPNCCCAQFIVPLQHKPGESSWWQGHYFDDLVEAWKYYSEEVDRKNA